MSAAQSRAREVAARVLLVVIAIGIAVFISDVALRLVGYQPTILDPEMFVADSDSLMPYALRPGYSGWYAGSHVSIDSNGFRVVRSAWQPSPRTPEKRLLLLGDSQVFGAGVADSETIPSQLQDSLAARGLNIRVLNIGVPGYSSWNEYRALDRYLAKHRVDDVILLYHPGDATFENDILHIGRGDFETPTRRVVRAMYRRVNTIAFLRQSWLELRARRANPASDTTGPSDSVMAYSMRAVQQAAELCRRQGIGFSVGVYRHIDALTSPVSWSAYEKRIRAALAERGIRWFLVASHTSHLRPREIMVSLADRHASARASSFIVTDILTAMNEH